MKKFLSLLSVLTISGNAVPITIAASPYQKINNLENLNINKRQSEKKLDIDENLIINEDEKENYKSSMEKIISLLINNNIFVSVFEYSENEQGIIYSLNRNSNYNYFNIPISIIQRGNTRSITLIFGIRDLYLQGFINNINNTRNYHHFTREVQDDLIYYLNINSENTNDLGYIGHYNNIMGQREQSIYWQNIASSFFEILNIGTGFESQRPVVQAASGRIVLAKSEALRFRSIYNLIINNIINNYSGGPIYWNPGQNSCQTNISSIVTNWQSISNKIIDAINNIQAIFGNKTISINELFYNLLSLSPLNMIAQILINTGVTVISGLLMEKFLDCDKGKETSINNYIKNEYCDAIKGQEQNYSLKNKNITTIKILYENTKGNNLSKWDIYIGTNEGLYFKKYNSNLFFKVDNIDDKIINITIRKNRNNYAVTDKEEIYFLRTDKFSSHCHLIGEKIFNAKSLNLEKEIKLYYDNNEQNIQVIFNPDPSGNNYWNTSYKTLNLGQLNLIDNYKKLEFIGDIDNDCWVTLVEWNNALALIVYTNDCASSLGDYHKWKLNGSSKSIKTFLKEKNNEFHNIIENTKDQVSSKKEQILQKFTDQVKEEKIISINQRFGLTWYWENDNYYLKVFTLQYCEWLVSNRHFNCLTKIGNGIRLYND